MNGLYCFEAIATTGSEKCLSLACAGSDWQQFSAIRFAQTTLMAFGPAGAADQDKILERFGLTLSKLS